MKRQVQVHLHDGEEGPVFFPVVGKLEHGNLQVLMERDWEVFYLPLKSTKPGELPPIREHPLVRIWDETGQVRLMLTHFPEVSPDPKVLRATIERWRDLDWIIHHAREGGPPIDGVTIPHFMHEDFALVPKIPNEQVPEAHHVLTVVPPCLLWTECLEGVVRAVITVS